MSRYLISAVLIVLLTGCAGTKLPYKIMERTNEGATGAITRITVQVPTTASEYDMTRWCRTILKDEKKPKSIVIEFFGEDSQKKSACSEGVVYMGSSRVKIE